MTLSTWPTSEGVRFYVYRARAVRDKTSPTTYPPYAVQAANWRPLNDDRCVVAPDVETGCRFMRTIVGNVWDPSGIWRNFPAWYRTVVRDYEPPPGVVVNNLEDVVAVHVMRTPPAGCVCVAIAFYPDADWVRQYAAEPDAPPPDVRDIRVFVGNNGSVDGPRFGDLTRHEDDLLADGTVLRLAALSAAG
jgi:hypothetical protein